MRRRRLVVAAGTAAVVIAVASFLVSVYWGLRPFHGSDAGGAESCTPFAAVPPGEAVRTALEASGFAGRAWVFHAEVSPAFVNATGCGSPVACDGGRVAGAPEACLTDGDGADRFLWRVVIVENAGLLAFPNLVDMDTGACWRCPHTGPGGAGKV
jgi:hypothetical protein